MKVWLNLNFLRLIAQQCQNQSPKIGEILKWKSTIRIDLIMSIKKVEVNSIKVELIKKVKFP